MPISYMQWDEVLYYTNIIKVNSKFKIVGTKARFLLIVGKNTKKKATSISRG